MSEQSEREAEQQEADIKLSIKQKAMKDNINEELSKDKS